MNEVQQDLHAIPLYSRAEFDRYWPVILKVRSAGSPVSVSRVSKYPLSHQNKPVARVTIYVPPDVVHFFPPMRDEADNAISSERARFHHRHYSSCIRTLTEEELALLMPDEIVGGLSIDREAENNVAGGGYAQVPGPPWPRGILDEGDTLPECVYPQRSDSGQVEWRLCVDRHPGICVRACVMISIQIDEDVIGVDDLDLPDEAEFIDNRR